MLAGSPGYQSPEQLRAETTGPASDVYAFGAVTFVIMMESPLWPKLTHFQIMQKVSTNQSPDTSSLTCRDIKHICDQCFRPKNERPPSSMLQVIVS